MTEIAGIVRRVVFNSDDFYILDMTVVESDLGLRRATAKGNLFGLVRIRSGVPIRLRGTWRRHRKYGQQLAFTSWEPWAEDVEGVETFLETCIEGFLISDIAERVAQDGPSVFEDVPGAVLRLGEGPNPITDTGALQEAVLGWERAFAVRDLSGLLKTGGLEASDIRLAMSRFGMEAASVIQDNPYRLMEVLSDFRKVDRLAIQLGLEPSDPRRVGGGVLWALRESTHQGHLYVPRGKLPGLVVDLFTRHSLASLTSVEDGYDNAVEALAEQGAVVLEPGVGVYLPEYYRYERDSASLLKGLLAPAQIDIDLKPFLEGYERANRITLSTLQRGAVERLAQDRVLVLTGLPGTGKTTAVRALVRLLEEAKVSFALMAPTGIAAKRLAAVTGQDASTIHRALRYDGVNWKHGEHNRYVVDAVIVDELSMVDQELFYRLLSALRPDTILVLVGDDAQLPSVGPGNVLRELVACPEIPNVRLTQIFRQAEKGEIVLSSHQINRGEMPDLTAKAPSEFRFIRLRDGERIVKLIVEMAAKLKSRDANFQVLSPKYQGVVGVDNLNEQLREKLNPPGPREWAEGGLHFRLGDRLMVTQNDYLRSVYNGDMGKLVGIGRDHLMVRIHGVGGGYDAEVEFPFDAAQEKLRLAYAVSVHKSQGSEFDTVILPIVKSQGWMLQRNLLYTAVTRAKEQVWLIGEEAAIQQAVRNNRVMRRNTVLARALSGVRKRHGEQDPGQAESGTEEAASDS